MRGRPFPFHLSVMKGAWLLWPSVSLLVLGLSLWWRSSGVAKGRQGCCDGVDVLLSSWVDGCLSWWLGGRALLRASSRKKVCQSAATHTCWKKCRNAAPLFLKKSLGGGQKEKHIFLIEIKLRASKIRRTELEKSKGAGWNVRRELSTPEPELF